MTIIKIALGLLGGIAVAAFMVLLVGGTVGTRIGRKRDRREPTTEVGGREFLGGDHPDDTDDDVPLDHLYANVLDGTPLPEVPADLRQAEIAELGPVEPEVRYWVTRPSIGWLEHEVTKGVYMRLEAEFGFRTEVGPEPVTRWFCDRFMVSAWTTRGGDRGDAPTSFAHHRDCRAAWVEPVDTIAAAKLNEMAARMAQPGMTRRRPIGDDSTDELTAPAEHASPRQHLARIAAAHGQHLGVRPVVHAQARTYDLQGIGSVCSGCHEEWPCDGSRVNGRPL